MWCSVLQRVAACFSILKEREAGESSSEMEERSCELEVQHVVACCNVLQCGAAWCNVLQCGAACCNMI